MHFRFVDRGHAHKSGRKFLCVSLPGLYRICLVCLFNTFPADAQAIDIIACQSEYFAASCPPPSPPPRPPPSTTATTAEATTRTTTIDAATTRHQHHHHQQQHQQQQHFHFHKHPDETEERLIRTVPHRSDRLETTKTNMASLHRTLNDTSRVARTERNDATKEVVVVEFAKFGRMNYSRCVRQSFGHVGCWSDVTDFFVHMCNYRLRCGLKIIGRIMVGRVVRACPIDLKSYLHVRYRCIPTIVPHNNNNNTRHVSDLQPTSNGIFSNVALLESNCAHPLSWHLRGVKGDRIILMVFDCRLSLHAGPSPRRTNVSYSLSPPGIDRSFKSSVEESGVFPEEEMATDSSWRTGKNVWRYESEQGWRNFGGIDYDRDPSRQIGSNRSVTAGQRVNSNKRQTNTASFDCIVYARLHDAVYPRDDDGDDDDDDDADSPSLSLPDGSKALLAKQSTINNSHYWSDLKICPGRINHLDSRHEIPDEKLNQLVDDATDVLLELSRNYLRLIYASRDNEIFIQVVETSVPFLLIYKVVGCDRFDTSVRCRGNKMDEVLLLKGPKSFRDNLKDLGGNFSFYVLLPCIFVLFILISVVASIVLFLKTKRSYKSDEIKEQCYEFSMTERKIERRLKGYAVDEDGQFFRNKRLNRPAMRDDMNLPCCLCKSRINTIFLSLPCECLPSLALESSAACQQLLQLQARQGKSVNCLSLREKNLLNKSVSNNGLTPSSDENVFGCHRGLYLPSEPLSPHTNQPTKVIVDRGWSDPCRDSSEKCILIESTNHSEHDLASTAEQMHASFELTSPPTTTMYISSEPPLLNKKLQSESAESLGSLPRLVSKQCPLCLGSSPNPATCRLPCQSQHCHSGSLSLHNHHHRHHLRRCLHHHEKQPGVTPSQLASGKMEMELEQTVRSSDPDRETRPVANERESTEATDFI